MAIDKNTGTIHIYEKKMIMEEIAAFSLLIGLLLKEKTNANVRADAINVQLIQWVREEGSQAILSMFQSAIQKIQSKIKTAPV